MLVGNLLIMSDNTVSLCSCRGEEIDCSKKMAYRFMGCSAEEKNAELDRLFAECEALVKKDAFFKAVWRKSSVEIIGEDTVRFDFGEIRSASLCKNLEGCREAYVFAATAGAGIDRLLLRYQNIDSVKAMVISAIGSSAVECWCDRVNEKIAEGKKTRPRFSPGYGGVELRHQREVLDFVDAQKNLGITLTDSFFMTPVKSVTAFIGVVEE